MEYKLLHNAQPLELSINICGMNVYVIHFYNLNIYHSEKKKEILKKYSTKGG